MTSSTAYSARTLVLAALVVGAVGSSALQADGLSDPWFDNNASCSSCIGGLDDPVCGDMSPTAMLPCGQWYFQANAIAFRRDETENQIFQTRNTNTLTSQEIFDADGNSLTPRVFELVSTIDRDTALATSDLDFENSAGYRLLLGWKLADHYAVEFSYFDLNDWNETAAISDATVYDVDGTINATTGQVTVTDTQPASLFSPFSAFGNPALAGYDFNERASISYFSSLDNVELNVRHWVTKRPSRLAVSLLWGGRYNGVRERFGYFTSSAVPNPSTNNSVDIHTQNDLWGFQVGTGIEFCIEPRWHLEFEAKGGVAQNRAVQESLYQIQNEAGTATNTYWHRDERDVTSWIGELRLTLVYQFGPHLMTHVGYEALVLSDIAVASRNFETDRAILANGPWVLNNGGSVVYHGPSAGFTFAW